MAIHKLSGGLEDLTMGMDTEEQPRGNSVVTITQINGSNIPYSSTRTINAKVDEVESTIGAVRSSLDTHTADKNNPHEVTPEDVGAAPIVHTHNMGQVDGLTNALNGKASLVHTHPTTDITGLDPLLATKADVGDSYLKTEHITESTGSADAGKPIILDSSGGLHPSISGSGLYPAGMYTPVAGDIASEYPDTTGETFGAYWGVFADEVTGFTFTVGDLIGQTVFPNDSVIYGSQGWSLFIAPTGSSDFYRLDGTIAITAPLAGGGQLAKNFAPAVEAGDLVEFSQISDLATSYMRVDGTIPMGANIPLGGFKAVGMEDGTDITDGVNKGQLDGVSTDLTNHEALVDNPHAVTQGQVGLGNVDNTNDVSKPISTATQTALDTKEPTVTVGTAGQLWATNATADGKEWIEAPNSAVWGSITGTLAEQTDLNNELNARVKSVQEGGVGTSALNMVIVTQAEYDALTKVATTIYYIVG